MKATSQLKQNPEQVKTLSEKNSDKCAQELLLLVAIKVLLSNSKIIVNHMCDYQVNCNIKNY